MAHALEELDDQAFLEKELTQEEWDELTESPRRANPKATIISFRNPNQM